MELNPALPPAFVDSLTDHFPERVVTSVLKGLIGTPSTSLRLHPRKGKCPWNEVDQVPWHPEALLLRERPNFALDPLFHAGSYYVQDSSSMMLSKVLDAAELPPSPLCLDVCAAPGGKSTAVLDYLDGKGLLIANEVHPNRNAVLRENLLKWGYLNHAVTALDADRLAQASAAFDFILVDAPCSGEGMFRKDEFAVSQWSPDLVDQCVSTQQSILAPLIPSLNPGGLLWYSTCTMNPLENEEQVLWMMEQFGLELALPDLGEFASYLVPAERDGTLLGYYLLPGISTGEGLFYSALSNPAQGGKHSSRAAQPVKLSKPSPNVLEDWPAIPEEALIWEWKSEAHGITQAHLLPENLFYKRIGLPLYQLKGKSVIPLHGLAMSRTDLPSIPVDRETALRYLRKETLYLRVEQPGWYVVNYDGVPLGWVKALANRTNNYYPNGLRLRI